MKGSLTVEASLVLPFCFFVIAIVCSLGIFQYNQAVLEVTGYECLIHTMELREDSEKFWQESIKKLAEETAKERLLGVEELSATVKITASKIIVNYRGNQSFLKLPLEVTVIYERVHPELTFRLLSGKMGE